MRQSHQVVIASANRDKFEEFKALFSSYPGIEPIPAGDVLRNPEKLGFAERHDTYQENAIAKARLANQGSHYPVLADDSGLECEGIEWKPGVRSHRYATPKAGLSQDQANTELLLKDLQGKSRNARMTCTLVLLIEGIMLTGTGVLEGTIAEASRGTHGFGYDPVFLPRGSSKTLAEMTEGEKNSISHRSKALHDLMAKVKAHGVVFARP